MRVRFLVALAPLAFAGIVFAGPNKDSPPDPASIVKWLDDTDPIVRDAAAAALVAQGDAALAALTAIPTDAPTARRDAAARVVAGIGRVKRLASKPKESVAWWVAFEDVLDHETGAVLDAVLASAVGHRYFVDLALERRHVARAAAIAFCRDWAHDIVPRPGSPEEAMQNRLKERILDAGAAAAPLLFRLMAGNHVKAYFVGYGSSSWMMVVIRAVHAARLLKLREAVPFFFYQATGMSPTGNGAAQWAIHEVVGTEFDRAMWGRVFGLDDATAPMVEWWKAHRAEYAEGMGYLVQNALAEAQADLAGRLATGAAPQGNEIVGRGLEPYEEAMARRLTLVVGDDMALHFSGDTAARLATVRAARAWAEAKFPR